MSDFNMPPGVSSYDIPGNQPEPVYVDDQRNPYGRMLMCHMVSEDLEALHEMADAIGVSRRWFQNKRIPHYDICQAKRALAVRHGALEVTAREIVQMFRRARAEAPSAPALSTTEHER